MNMLEFIDASKWLASQEFQLLPLLTLDEVPSKEMSSKLKDLQAGLLTKELAVIKAYPEIDPRTVFLSAASDKQSLIDAHGCCRYLAETPEEIKKLDEIVSPLLQDGYLEDIAIRVYPNESGAFTANNIPEFAQLIRRTDNLAVRALFVPFDLGGDLSQQAKDAFSLVKKIRSDLPCILHAFCFEGVLGPLANGDPSLIHTLRMLASLNDTSLYASFFIS